MEDWRPAPSCTCGQCETHRGVCGRCNRAVDDHIAVGTSSQRCLKPNENLPSPKD